MRVSCALLGVLVVRAAQRSSFRSRRFYRHVPHQLFSRLAVDLALPVEPLLVVRRVLREQLGILHRRLLAIVRDDEVRRRLMTTSGVGPVVALTYRATVDVPARFRKSKSVGAVFGLTCAKYQSGESERSGRISRCGDEMMRVLLYEAAQAMLHSKRWSSLKAWAMKIARHRGMKKAIVALARRLAGIMHDCTAKCPLMTQSGHGRHAPTTGRWLLSE